MKKMKIHNRFIRNTSWILAGQIVRLAVSFLVSILTARYLGPANNGIISYVNSYIAFFGSVVGLGLNGVIIHEFVNHLDEEGKILGTAIALRLFFGVVSAFAFIGCVYYLDGNDQAIMTVAFLQSVQLPFLCLDTINYWYQSKMQSKYSVIAQTTAYIFMVLYKAFLLIAGKDVLWFAAANTLDVVILSGLYFLFYSKHKTQRLGFSKDIAKRLLMNGLPFILANLMVVVYGQIDKIMIKQLMDSTEQVGLYSTALVICSMIGFIPVAFLDSARPLIAEAKNQSEELYRLRFRQLVAGIMWLCFAYSFFVTLFSNLILRLLYGEAYMGANVCLKIAVWYTAFSYLGSARSYWLICENKKKYVFVFSAIGAGCNVIMNLIFIPSWGINGAALATLITQVLANFIIPILIPDTREYGKTVISAVFLKNIQLRSFLALITNKLRRN